MLDLTPVIATPTVSPIAVTPSPSPIGDTNDLSPIPASSTDEQPQETQPTDEIYPCDLPDPPEWCDPPNFVQPELPTGTGWENCGDWSCDNDGFGGGGGAGIAPTETLLRPPEQTPVVVTTRTPTIVEIKTSVEPSATKDVNGGRTSQAVTSEPPGEHTRQQEPHGQPGQPGQPGSPTGVQDPPQTGGTGEGSSVGGGTYRPVPESPTAGLRPETANSNVPTSQQTTSTGNSLLDTIINQIGKARPGAQPSQAILPTSGVSGEYIKQEPQLKPSTDTAGAGQSGSVQGGGAISVQSEEIKSGTVTLGVTNTAPTQHTIAIGNQITLGSATLSLTPGLSTIIGSGTDTTLIAIQTDSVSYTVITISSSGTAVTATITDAPATVTLPKTGFEASITDSAGRGVATSHAGQSTTATSSKGIADDRRAYIDGWPGAMIGLLALALW